MLIHRQLALLSVFTAAFLLFVASPAMALIEVGRGNTPIHDLGWPNGALEVANLKIRVGFWAGPPFGGGHHEFLYRGDTAAFTQALNAFAAIRAPSLELFVHPGSMQNEFLKDPRDPKADTRVDFTFDVWRPESWHRLYNNPKSVFASDRPEFRRPIDPPRMHVYLGGGSIKWDQIKVPANVRVIDLRGLKKDGEQSITGSVYDMATGKTIAQAQLTLQKYDQQGNSVKLAETATDDQGRFEFPKAPADARQILVTSAGYAKRLVLLNADQPGLMDIQLSRQAGLSGIITDDSGRGLDSVRVRADATMGIDGRGYASPDGREATTDAKGRFTFENLPTGYVQLYLMRKDYARVGNVFEIYDVPGKELSFVMTGTGTIRGKVVDKNGKPLATGHIHVVPEGEQIGKWGGSMQLKPDGTFQFTNVPPGTYYVSTMPLPDMAIKDPGMKKVTLTSGMSADVEIVGR